MKTLIYIEVINSIEHEFYKEEFERLKKKYPDCTPFDIDNFSDSPTIVHLTRLINEAEKIYLFFNIKYQNGQLNKLLRMFSTFTKNKHKIEVLNAEVLHPQLRVLINKLS